MKQSDIERQDEVDNAIHALLEKLAGKPIDWDIEMIGAVRDEVMFQLVDCSKLMTAEEFYP